MPIKFPVKVYIVVSPSDDLPLHSMSQLLLKLDTCLTCTIIVRISDSISAMALKLATTVDLRMAYKQINMLMQVDLDLNERSQWVGKGKTKISVGLSRQLSKQ